MLEYKILCDNGTEHIIKAKCRKDAVKYYLEQHGMPSDFFRRHCTVRLLGGKRNEKI